MLLLAVVLCSLSAVAQSKYDRWGGVYYAYHAPEDAKLTPAPEGFRPFYISHYGRHGSRWLPSDSRYEWVNSQFADNKNLTKLGKSVKKRLAKIWKNAQGNGGKLTPLGAEQHRGIARRMMEHYPEVFADTHKKIEARSSVYDRCSFFFSANYGQIDSLVDDGREDYNKYRLIPFIPVAGLLATAWRLPCSRILRRCPIRTN